jgi:hypothetical protein
MIAAMHQTTDPYASAVEQYVVAVAQWAVADARAGLISLMSSFGSSTEPDFNSIAPVYNRVLAIALLVTGAIIAVALMERILGGTAASAGTLCPGCWPRSSSPTPVWGSWSMWLAMPR